MATRKTFTPASRKAVNASAKTRVKRTAAAPSLLTAAPSSVVASPSAGHAAPVAVGRTAPVPTRKLTIIGVGASAGGLEAIEQFLRPIPVGKNWAVVVVQHLDPAHVGFLPELLQKNTKLKVVSIKNGARVQPDFVYVIPTNRDLTISDGVLQLHAAEVGPSGHLPINRFLQSLATDQREQGVGVIMSGMGCDGSQGAKAIKEHGGVVLAQDPVEAKFASMPSSVGESGLADIVAPTGGLFARLQEYLAHAPLLTGTELEYDPLAASALDKVFELLRAHTGHDFSDYKHSTLYRRIERRMGLHEIARINDYVRYLRENPQEVELLFRELLIGVTHFFRDPVIWDTLKQTLLPKLIGQGEPGRTLRAWVPGCSTGEEAYSLAMVFKEVVEALPHLKKNTLKIFATDIDPDAVTKARQGLFPAAIAESVSAERLERFFSKEKDGYRINKEIREMIVFAPHNLIMSPPFTKLDLLSCRNLLIYFTAELQKRLLPDRKSTRLNSSHHLLSRMPSSA